MDLERLAIRLRPRNGWESVDLGFALVRRWWRLIYGRWLALTLPAAFLGAWFLGGDGLLLLWWLLPLGEVVVLFTLSRAVFGATPTRQQTLKALPGLWRRALVGELLLRRLHPARILRLPVGQLEGLGGRERRRRSAALAVGETVSGQLAAAFIAFELGLLAAAAVFVVLMTPGWTGVDWTLFGAHMVDGSSSRPVATAIWLLAAAVLLVLHPLYVGAGFAVYLNRRTELEGWDLEIAFRRLARRLETPAAGEPRTGAGTRVTAAAAVLALGLAVSAATLPAAAEEGSPAAAPTAGAWAGDPERDPRRVAAEVMALPELQSEETVARWRLRRDLLPDVGDAAGSDRRPPRILGALAYLIVNLGEPLLWGGGLVVLVLLGRALWQRLAAAPRPPPEDRPPERLLGLDLRPETLPADIPAAAAELWSAGRPAAALSLLYRGALARLAAEGLELRESFTEDDCLRSARGTIAAPRAAFFADLTRAWQRVAYAHRIPEARSAARLWSSWGEHFGEPA